MQQQNELNVELTEMTAEENTGISHNKKYVHNITKEYSDAGFRPKFEVS